MSDYEDVTDCPICPMIATDRDDALNEAQTAARELAAALHCAQLMSLEHQRMAELCEALSTNVIRLTEEKEQNHHNAQLIYLEQQRWQAMAEDLWEELQEWHFPDCVDVDGNGTSDVCTCHRILAVKWDELTHAADYADDGAAS